MKDITNMRDLLLVIFILFFSYQLNAQERKYPVIGEKIGFFTLKDENYQSLSSETLRGKYYILDFWSFGCLSCIASFPKVDSLQEKYSGKLTILLTGPESRKRDAKKFYEVYRKKYDLKISSYFDSLAFSRFVPRGTPHLIWVNRNGIVVAITSTEDLTDENVAKFLNDKSFHFFDASHNARLSKKPFDKEKPLLINGNGGDDASYMFRSMFSSWDQNKLQEHWPDVQPVMDGTKSLYLITGAPVKILYILAYFGTLSVADKVPDAYPFPSFSSGALNYLKAKFNLTRFNYCLEIPKANTSRERLMAIMQNDLNSFFGLNARFVDQEISCYELSIIDEEKFSKHITKNGFPKVSWNTEDSIHTFSNLPANQILPFLKSKIISKDRIIFHNNIIVDERVTFEIRADVHDINSIQNGLHAIGMELKHSLKVMRVLEITEGHP